MDLGNLFRTFDLGQALEPMAVMPSIVEPTALVTGARKDFINRLPEPKSTVPDSHFGGCSQSTGPDINEQFPPTLRTLADPDMEAKQLFPALRRRPDDHQDTFCFRFHPRLQVNPIRHR